MQTVNTAPADACKGSENGRFLAVTNSHFYAPVAVGIWAANWELGCEALGIEGTLVAPATSGPDTAAPPHHDLTWLPTAP